MKAARSWGVRPSEFFDKWSARDRSLALGLQAFEGGYYMGLLNEVVYDPDSEGHLAAVPVVNQVDLAIAQAQERNKELSAGTQWQVFDVREHPEYEKYLANG